MKNDLTQLSAIDAADAIREGRLTSEALTEACLARISSSEPTILAWAHLDRKKAMDQARDLDRIRRAGRATGALHGVPVGVKDIVDTRDMPTECGSPVFAKRRPDRDARLIERLRDAGAVILGKTKTTEFAFMQPTDTTNPHDISRTPGGSSSGSAAAVAARHVPLAIGTQTGGSVIRPASFCGVYGFKPTQGTISRSRVFRTSVSLDHVGCFANTLEDIALLTDALAGYDQNDPSSFVRPHLGLREGMRDRAPVDPDFAWFDLPFNDRLDPDSVKAFEVVLERLGPRVERIPASPQMVDLTAVHQTIYDYELLQNMAELAASHWSDLSVNMQAAITRGRDVSEAQYKDALGMKTSAKAFFSKHFEDFDAILAPSATGEAPPIALGTTGDSIFCTIWTLAGLPALSLPLLVGENGLPVGLQVIGAGEEDDHLMRNAAWLQNTLANQ